MSADKPYILASLQGLFPGNEETVDIGADESFPLETSFDTTWAKIQRWLIKTIPRAVEQAVQEDMRTGHESGIESFGVVFHVQDDETGFQPDVPLFAKNTPVEKVCSKMRPILAKAIRVFHNEAVIIDKGKIRRRKAKRAV